MNAFDNIPLSYEILFEDEVLETILNEFLNLFN